MRKSLSSIKRIVCGFFIVALLAPAFLHPALANNDRDHNYGLIVKNLPDLPAVDDYSRIGARAQLQTKITSVSDLWMCREGSGVTCKNFTAGTNLPTATVHCAGNQAQPANGGWVVDSVAGQCWTGLTVCYGDGTPGNCAPVTTSAPAPTLESYSKCTSPGKKGACVYGGTGLLTVTGDDMFRLESEGAGFLDFLSIGATTDPHRLKWIARVDGPGGQAMMVPSGPPAPAHYEDYQRFVDAPPASYVQAEPSCYPVKARLCDTTATLPSIAGVCGAANGVAVSSAPTSDLCLAGKASILAGTGPWTWTCEGWSGGKAASCSAPMYTPPPVNGVCGVANGKPATVKPVAGLCTSGTTSAVAGAGPWTWHCEGQNGGSSAACSAPLNTPPPVNGVCGPAYNVTTATKPVTGLCSSGVEQPVTEVSTTWLWHCAGIDGGTTTECTAPKPTGSCETSPGGCAPTNECFFWVSGIYPSYENNRDKARAKIGDVSMSWGMSEATMGGSSLVGKGSYPDSYGSAESPGPFFKAANASFDGIALGKNTRVTIYKGANFSGPVLFDQRGPMVIGNDIVMGSADTIRDTYPTFKTESWASYGALFSQFPPSTRYYSSDPPINLPATTDGMWSLAGIPEGKPMGFGPTSVKVTCDAPVNGACGTANAKTLAAAPSSTELCSSGTATAFKSYTGGWTWSCSGAGGGTTAACEAWLGATAVNGACGSSHGKVLDTAPTSGLCSAGTASSVTGSGPWSWSCTGTGGGTNATCKADFQPALCGEANGVSRATAPTTGLCSRGTASSVTGSGPWSWTCKVGTSTTSCSAPKGTEECVPQGTTPKAGQTQCPTNSCFFYVVGGLATGDPAMGDSSFVMIGDVTKTGFEGNVAGAIVGAGNYPDSFGSASAKGPFYGPQMTSFDGMALGAKTHVTIYNKTNYTGGVMVSLTGPIVVDNAYSRPSFARSTIQNSTLWTSSPLVSQFTPSTRKWSDEVGAANPNMWYWGGTPNPARTDGFGPTPSPTSVKVTCDP